MRRRLSAGAQSRHGRILLPRCPSIERRPIQDGEAAAHGPSPSQLESLRRTAAMDDLFRTGVYDERVYETSHRNRAQLAHGSGASLLQEQRD